MRRPYPPPTHVVRAVSGCDRLLSAGLLSRARQRPGRMASTLQARPQAAGPRRISAVRRYAAP